MHSVAYSTFGCRIILNLRAAGSAEVVYQTNTESHIVPNGAIQMSGMAFRPGLETNCEEDETDSIPRSLANKKAGIPEPGSNV